VCTSGRDLDLSKGAISKSLLSVAGSSLQDQCKKDFPTGLRDGQIGQTKGYKLSCQEVYHAVVSKWDSSSGEGVSDNIQIIFFNF